MIFASLGCLLSALTCRSALLLRKFALRPRESENLVQIRYWLGGWARGSGDVGFVSFTTFARKERLSEAVPHSIFD
jgi:hypothetical protein